VSWTDGFVGVRGAYIFTDKWSVVGYADAGAGGTKHSWQLLASANYNFSKTIVGKLGYRIISMDYEKTEFLFNMKTSGIFAGVGIKF
jgi:opacity protein-like surface antigen